VDLFDHQLWDLGHIRVLMDHRLHRLESFQILTFSFRVTVVTSTRITTEMPEVVVVVVVL
jgi:hypothetical protein